MKVANPKTLTLVQKLKQEADQKGIAYKKNATEAQMRELLDNNNAQAPDKAPADTYKESKLSVEELLRQQAEQIKNLEELVKKTGDHNKIKEFEDAKKGMEGFSFSLKLFPTNEGDFPVIKWRTLKNYVARNESDTTDQTIEITYIKQGEEKVEELNLVDFVRVLKRTKPILATTINNPDGSEVYVEEKTNPEEKLPFFIMRPKINEKGESPFYATLSYKGQELKILSTYLNA